MSVDRSLKSSNALARHRSVLTRGERIEKLADDDKWNEEEDSVFGLPKVVHRKSHAGRKTHKKETTEEAAAATEAGEETPAETPAASE